MALKECYCGAAKSNHLQMIILHLDLMVKLFCILFQKVFAYRFQAFNSQVQERYIQNALFLYLNLFRDFYFFSSPRASSTRRKQLVSVYLIRSQKSASAFTDICFSDENLKDLELQTVSLLHQLFHFSEDEVTHQQNIFD